VARKERYIVGLDVGTSKVAAIVAEPAEHEDLNIVGMGVAESHGIRRGLVVNLEAAVESIKKAIVEAELTAGIEIDNAYLALSGPHVKGFNSRGVVAVAGKNHEIGPEDLSRAIEAAKAVSLPGGRQIILVLPQDFVVDDQDGITAPIGMTGARLEVNVHIVTGGVTATQNLIACVNRAGVQVRGTVLGQLAASDAVLSPDEMDLGVCLLDIGGGTSDLAIFERGSLWHTAVIGVGGDNITNDIAVGLRCPIAEAERLKIKYGHASASRVSGDEQIEVPSMGGDSVNMVPRRILAEIIESRVEELFKLAYNEIRNTGYSEMMSAGLVLTGGASSLEGVAELAESIMHMPVRVGLPRGVKGLVELVNSPAYATAVGLCVYEAGKPSYSFKPKGTGVFERILERMISWFKEVF